MVRAYVRRIPTKHTPIEDARLGLREDTLNSFKESKELLKEAEESYDKTMASLNKSYLESVIYAKRTYNETMAYALELYRRATAMRHKTVKSALKAYDRTHQVPSIEEFSSGRQNAREAFAQETLHMAAAAAWEVYLENENTAARTYNYSIADANRIYNSAVEVAIEEVNKAISHYNDLLDILKRLDDMTA